jgi:hypothetical protein
MSSRPPSPPVREVDVLRRAVGGLLERLPPTWKTQVQFEVPAGNRRIDALVEIDAPDGQRATLLVEAKAQLAVRDIARALEQAQENARALGREATPVLVARYLSPSVQDTLVESDVGYADATGNLWLNLERPALFVRDVGARKDPWRGPGRPRGDLRGATAARLVRTLVDFRPPYSLPALSKLSDASVGATYRMIDFLQEEALVKREERGGPIVFVEWRKLLTRWAGEFRVKAPPFTGYLEPRGFETAMENLRKQTDATYVVTGSVAAAHFAPYAPSRLGMVYAQDPDGVAERLGLREVDRGPNILLAAPLDGVIFERARTIDGLRIAAPSQIAADLLVSPGRGPEEAEVLLDWMEAHETDWRR